MASKVLVLANSVGGLYNFRRELVEKLREKYNVSLCVPEGEYTAFFKNLGCKCIPLAVNRHGINPIEELKLVNYFKQVLKQEKPDVVLTYTIKPNVYGGMACASLGVPYIANITGLGTAVENGGLMQKLTVGLYRYGLRKAQMVFFQNTENRDFMLNHGVVKGRYDLLPGSGVNLSRYQVLDYPNGDTVDFVFIARIMKEKGIDQYLEAAEYIREKYPNTRFHVCGTCEQDYEGKLNDLQNRGIIIYHGQVKDIAEIHKISQCTIHPTYYPEGLSNVLLESCACGRPIITTNRSGCREVVDNGVNGFVVEAKNSQDLIEKVERFLGLSKEERKKMGLAGRSKVEKDFDRQIVVDKYMKELNKNEKAI